MDNPAHPGEYFPRTSGMRFRYDPSRPKFDVVTAIELGDLDRGYKAIDISGKDARLYSLTCPLYLGQIIMAIPKYTKGKLALVAQEQGRDSPSRRRSRRSTTRATARPTCCRRRARRTRAVSPPGRGKNAAREIKEWQAIMDHLRSLPVKSKGELPVIPVDERAAEVRAIKAG